MFPDIRVNHIALFFLSKHLKTNMLLIKTSCNAFTKHITMFYRSHIFNTLHLSPIHSEVFTWKIYATRRDCYSIDFNSFSSFNECLMMKNLHESIFIKDVIHVSVFEFYWFVYQRISFRRVLHYGSGFSY